MSKTPQTFVRYTIGARSGCNVVMEIVQPLYDSPILFDESRAIVRIDGARLVERDGESPTGA